MAKMDKPANETFVKKTVEDARTELNGKIENLQKEIGIKHNEVMNKLDSIAGSIKNLTRNRLLFPTASPNTQTSWKITKRGLRK